MSTITPAQIAQAIDTHPPTPEQEAVITAPMGSPLLVVAGAGSGKTETMAFRVLYLLANGLVHPERVLGLTFTRKAAGELRERMTNRLGQLVQSGLLSAEAKEMLGLTPKLDPDAAAPLDTLAPTVEAAAAGAPAGKPQMAPVDVATYDSFAQRVVREFGLSLGIPGDSTLVANATEIELAFEIVNNWPEDIDANALSSRALAVVALSNEIDSNGLSLEEVRQGLADLEEDFDVSSEKKKTKVADILKARQLIARRDALLDLVEQFRQAKAKAGLVSFSQLSAAALRIVTELEHARAQISSRYDLVLLDEFQDTSATQVRTFAQLFAGRGVTAVGDPNQAIYGWRGASTGTLEQFVVQFGVDLTLEDGRPRGVRTLSTAWRNGLSILAAANRVAQPLNDAAQSNNSGQSDDSGQQGVKASAAAAVRLRELTPSPAAEQGEVLVARAGHEDDEPALVASLIAKHWKKDRTMAVLSRARAPLGPIRDELEKLGIPAQIAGEDGLINTQDVADVRAALQLVADPLHGPAAVRLLSAARLSAQDMDAVQQIGRALAEVQGGEPLPVSLAEAIEYVRAPGATGAAGAADAAGGAGARAQSALGRLSDQARAVVADLGERLARLRELTHLALPELVRAAFGVLGLETDIAARPQQARERARGIQRTFIATAHDYSVASPRTSLGGFLTWLEQVDQADSGLRIEAPPAQPGVVQILTMHASKGLEWDVVAVCGLAADRFPKAESKCKKGRWTSQVDCLPYPLRPDSDYLPKLSLSQGMDADIAAELFAQYTEEEITQAWAEERRIAYVAFTRARHLLILTSYAAAGEGKGYEPSPFLAGILPTELERQAQGETLQNIDVPTDSGSGAEVGQGIARVAVWEDSAGFAPRCRPVPATPEQGSGGALAPDSGADSGGGSGSDGAPAPDSGAGGADAPVLGPGDPLWLGQALPHDLAGRVLWPDHLYVDTELEANQLLAQAVRQAQRGTRPAQVLRELADDPHVGPGAQDVAVLLEQARAGERTTVRLPARLAATATASLLEDPQAFARQLRRPLPRPPHTAANVGTAFHQLIEQELKKANLLDLDDAPPPAALDQAAQKRVDAWLEWAMAQPIVQENQVVCVEEEIQLPVGPVQLVGRIDAVFKHTTPDGERYLVVDWKTGRVPKDPQDRLRKAYQLAVYRDAYAATNSLDPQQVEAIFVYVSAQQCIRLQDLAPGATTEHLASQIKESLSR
ncbi:ATP-dependent DNA helicase [Buchananella felis]|uniref:ATP-dependent helicase n=1 Tax=Buchananella felis TaxID=3231492 RepID=UPI003527881C